MRPLRRYTSSLYFHFAKRGAASQHHCHNTRRQGIVDKSRALAVRDGRIGGSGPKSPHKTHEESAITVKGHGKAKEYPWRGMNQHTRFGVTLEGHMQRWFVGLALMAARAYNCELTLVVAGVIM
jgi:hypothetical protein